MKRAWGLLAAHLLVPVAVAGQAAPTSGELSAGYSDWSGKNVEGLQAGYRLQATFFAGLEGPVDVGITGAFGSVGLEGFSENAKEWGAGLTGRVALGPLTRPHVFVDAYAGWTRLEVEITEVGLALEENGVALGPGVGFSFPVRSSAVIVAADVHWHRYGNIRAPSGPSLGSEGDSGWRYGFRGGLSVGRGN